jgi:hypothetical protein
MTLDDLSFSVTLLCWWSLFFSARAGNNLLKQASTPPAFMLTVLR